MTVSFPVTPNIIYAYKVVLVKHIMRSPTEEGTLVTGSYIPPTCQRPAYRTLCCTSVHYVGNVTSFTRLVSLSKTLYHTCFIRRQGCKWWCCWLKLTVAVIFYVKRIIYSFFYMITILFYSIIYSMTNTFDFLVWLSKPYTFLYSSCDSIKLSHDGKA